MAPAVSEVCSGFKMFWFKDQMKESTKRTIARWVHLVFAIPIVGYIYSPFEELPNYAPVVRFVALPIMVITGLWMWKGHWIRRLFSKKPTQSSIGANT